MKPNQPVPVGTFHSLNCFRHVIYALKTSLYQNWQNFWLTQVLAEEMDVTK